MLNEVMAIYKSYSFALFLTWANLLFAAFGNNL